VENKISHLTKKKKSQNKYNKNRITVCTNFNKLLLQHILFGFGQSLLIVALLICSAGKMFGIACS